MFLRALFLLTVLGLSACAVVPDPIKVSDEKTLVGYNKAVISGTESSGQNARWGGIITNVENKPDQTIIEVVHFPLNNYGKPLTNEDTAGRFKAVIANFVDPILFGEGRLVTFVGTVGAPLAGMVGEQPYMFPSIDVENYYLWRKQNQYDTSSVYFDFYAGWYSPFYYSYWRPWGLFYPRYRIYTHSTTPPLSGSRDGGNKVKLVKPNVKRSSSATSGHFRNDVKTRTKQQ